MASNTPDSYKLSLSVINAIKKHPILYIPEVKSNTVKPQEFRQKVWKKISNELGVDPDWVKLKWKNLRDTYCRILKSTNKSSRGLKKKKWIYEDAMAFLKIQNGTFIDLSEDYINDINSEDISPKDLLDQLETVEVEGDDYSEYLLIQECDSVTEEQIPLPKSNVSKKGNTSKTMNIGSSDKQQIIKLSIGSSAEQSKTKSQENQATKRKLENISNLTATSKSILPKIEATVPCKKQKVDDTSCKVVNSNVPNQNETFDYNNSVDEFFKNIARNVKKLPPKVQADIKLDVCKIVSEAEICYLKKNTLQGVQKYTNMPGMIQKLVLVPCHMIDDQIKAAKK